MEISDGTALRKRKIASYLQLGDLDTDMEELAGSLNIGVVAAGDLVLAGEAGLGKAIGRVVGRSHLAPGQARQQA